MSMWHLCRLRVQCQNDTKVVYRFHVKAMFMSFLCQLCNVVDFQILPNVQTLDFDFWKKQLIVWCSRGEKMLGRRLRSVCLDVVPVHVTGYSLSGSSRLDLEFRLKCWSGIICSLNLTTWTNVPKMEGLDHVISANVLRQ